MRYFDFSTWQSILTSLVGLALFALIGIGLRVMLMLTVQQRQQRLNRQINERLRTLMAAYKVLGGAFTGKLTVDPRSRRDYERQARAWREVQRGRPDSPPSDQKADEQVTLAPTPERAAAVAMGTAAVTEGTGSVVTGPSYTRQEALLDQDAAVQDPVTLSPVVIERHMQKRDAVEAALSDVLLLGTEEHVRLAGKAAAELAQGHVIHTAELVVSLRNYIRGALDLEKVPADAIIPAQGPTRIPPASGRGGRSDTHADGRSRDNAGGSGMGEGMGGGMGAGMGAGLRQTD